MRKQSEVSSSASLRIAVIGIGGIGSAFAYQLARSGHHDVTAVARPGSLRLDQLRQDNGIVQTNGERAEVRVTEALDEQTPYDLVIVTLLAHQIDAVLPALQRSAARCVLFMFNQFEPERLRDEMGPDRCAFGMPFLQASLDQSGKLTTKIGAGGQKSKLSQQAWVDLFNAAGLPAILEPDMLLWLRCHVPLCIAFESVSVAAVRRGGGASWGEAMVLALGMQESFALIRGLGYKIYPSGKSLLQAGPTWGVAAMLWSVSRIRSFTALLATGAGECRALVEVLVAAARRTEPPVIVARIEAMKPLQNTP
jgi:2-dehydropantoate 2-reductase